MRKLMFGAVLSVGIVAGFSQVAEAAPYGTAGCGLGSIVFGDKPGIVQIFAATTNGLFGTQTFGITTGTSNCASTSGGSAGTQAFVEANRESVSKDIARGSGETLDNLASLAGCSDKAAVGSTLQRDFDSIFPDATITDTQVGENVIKSLKSHPELGCGQLI